MVDLLTLWKEHIFINDPRVKQVSTRFLLVIAIVVLVVGLVHGLVSQEAPGTAELGPTSDPLVAEGACMQEGNTSTGQNGSASTNTSGAGGCPEPSGP